MQQRCEKAVWTAGCEVSFPLLQTLTHILPPPPPAPSLNLRTHNPPLPHTAASFLWKLIPWGPFPLPATIRGSKRENADWIQAQRHCSVVFPSAIGRCSGSRPYILSDFATPGSSFRLLRVQANSTSFCKVHFVFSISPSSSLSRGCCSQSSSETGSNRPELDLVAVETVSASLWGRIRPHLLFSFPPSCFPSHHQQFPSPLPLQFGIFLPFPGPRPHEVD